MTPEVMWGLFAWLVGYAPTAWEYDLWRCEECRASWESGWHQCMRCGNRTREPAPNDSEAPE